MGTDACPDCASWAPCKQTCAATWHSERLLSTWHDDQILVGAPAAHAAAGTREADAGTPDDFVLVHEPLPQMWLGPAAADATYDFCDAEA